MTTIVRQVTSRHNDLFKDLRKLLTEPAAYRKLGRVWLEGDHLCRALLERGRVPLRAIVTESAWAKPALESLARGAPEVVCVPDALMRELSGLESPAPIGFLIEADTATAPQPGRDTVVLDRLQDPGNVGSVLRSAAALGFTQAIALVGTAALWSPKVVRGGMGAHFGLRLVEGAAPEALAGLTVPMFGASSHAERRLGDGALPWPCAWVFGHEGQGVASEVAGRCEAVLAIPQPGGGESLNVAAAAAICLYETVRTRAPLAGARPHR